MRKSEITRAIRDERREAIIETMRQQNPDEYREYVDSKREPDDRRNDMTGY